MVQYAHTMNGDSALRSSLSSLVREVVRGEDVIICSRVSVSLYRSLRGYQDCLSIEFKEQLYCVSISLQE